MKTHIIRGVKNIFNYVISTLKNNSFNHMNYKMPNLKFKICQSVFILS